MNQKPSLSKGTRDFLPSAARKRKYIFEVIEKTFKEFGYQPLETPAMENLSTLEGKYGEEGDKLLFRILNSGDFLKNVSNSNSEFLNAQTLQKIISEKGLRYDLTVPFARVVSMNRHLIQFPFKRYQIQPVWRADKPQRGRYREFYQCDADVVGSKSLLYESELILIYDRVFHQLGIDVKIAINHRSILEGFAEEAGRLDLFVPMTMSIDKLDKIGADRVREELEEMGFSNEKAQWILQSLGTHDLDLNTFRFNESVIHGSNALNQITDFLSTIKLFNKLEFSPSLARGLSYYTGCIFEIIPIGIQMGSLGGGGRYDNLTGIFGLPDVSGVGISFGADRIFDVMEELNLFPNKIDMPSKLFIISLDELSLKHSFSLAQNLRDSGISVDVYPEPVKIKRQFKHAEDLKIPFVLIVGEEESRNKIYTLKDQADGSQRSLTLNELIELLT